MEGGKRGKGGEEGCRERVRNGVVEEGGKREEGVESAGEGGRGEEG